MINGIQVVVFRNATEDFSGRSRTSRRSPEGDLAVAAGGNGSQGESRHQGGRPFRVMPAPASTFSREVSAPTRQEIEACQDPERWDGLA